MRLALMILSVFFTFLSSNLASAFEINENLSISGTVTSVYQWLNMTKGYLDEEGKEKRKDRGSLALDLGISIKPYEQGEFFIRTSFAKGNGLKGVSPFVLPPNGDDLSDDLKNINGRSRDHLLELWYAHKFELKENMKLRLQAGIVDSAAYIDDNAYANSEIKQFMNPALVNSPVGNRPTYDLGAAIEFEWDSLSVRVLGIRSKNEFERHFNFLVGQIGVKLESPIGEGNYRVYVYGTDKKFPSWNENQLKPIRGLGVSFDQQIIKDILGAFFRAGFQNSSVMADYKGMYSLGVNINGNIWGRKDDEIGIGYAYLRSSSKNPELKNSQVFESYVSFRLFSYKFLQSDLTIDFQHLRDSKKHPFETVAGNVFGVRLNLSF